MNLKLLRKSLWILVAIGGFALVALKPWTNEGVGSPDRQEAAFHADFELTDQTGTIRTDEDFAGQWLLIFFGFANCPDICPTTLAEVASVMDALGPDAAEVQPLFISIDPQRDTPQSLAEYVPAFSPTIVGLTGTPEQIGRTSRNFHIFYEKIEEASAPGGYTMGHSSQLFLFSPRAEFVTSWSYGTPAEEVLADLRRRMQS